MAPAPAGVSSNTWRACLPRAIALACRAHQGQLGAVEYRATGTRSATCGRDSSFFFFPATAAAAAAVVDPWPRASAIAAVGGRPRIDPARQHLAGGEDEGQLHRKWAAEFAFRRSVGLHQLRGSYINWALLRCLGILISVIGSWACGQL